MAVILPLSGKNAEAAADVLSGLKIGVETVNNSGGINGKQVELSILDSSNPEFAFVETFNSLYDRGIRHFHIGFTQETALKFDFMKEKEDCFFNFPEKVMKPLVQNGYRFNTMLDETARVLQAVFTQYKPEAKAVADAVQKLKDGQEEKAK